MVTRPWMPLYVADYLADTTHLSAAEHGAYLLLIMHYWQSGGLPKEDRKLARIARMSDREWKDARETVAEFFDDEWRHSRIDKELSESAEKYERRAMAGKKGGIAKAERVANGKQSFGNASGNATPKQEALLYQPQPQSHSDNLPAQIPVPDAPAESDRPASERPPDPGAASVRNELDAVETACRAALGEAQPQDLVIGPMVETVRKFGQERVSLCLASEARRPRRKPIRTWKIWAEIVDEVLTAPSLRSPFAPSGQATPAPEPPSKRRIWSRGRWSEARPEFEPPPPGRIASIPFESGSGRDDGLIALPSGGYRWESEFRAHLRRWVEGDKRRHLWVESRFGTIPSEPGCSVPDDLLAEFGLERVPYPRDDEDAA